MWYSGFAEFEAALDLLTESPDLGDALGRAGRAHVEREYAWPTVLARYEGLLREVAGTRTAGMPPGR